jgi:hypothetical protein
VLFRGVDGGVGTADYEVAESVAVEVANGECIAEGPLSVGR